MQTGAFRAEVIRFGLLVTMTVALLSVAIRISSHSPSHASHPGAQRPPHGTVSSAPATAPSSSAAQPTGPSAPQSTTGGSSRTGTGGATGGEGGTTGGSTGGGRTGGGGSTGGASGPAVLPVTGWDSTVRLTALSFVLLGAGALSLRASRR